MALIVPIDLTADAFAPYGEAFHPAAVTTRTDHVAALHSGRPAARPNLFMARTGVVALPHAFDRMEAHPWSSQSFVPLGDATVVIAVALADAEGQPDPATLRAFLARGCGFSYRAGVLHLPVATLGVAIPVMGLMYEDGGPEDCVWARVEASSVAAP